MTPLELQTHPDRGSVSFAVRVQPRASKNEVSGVLDGALKIKLQAPAVENQANEALCAFLAELLKQRPDFQLLFAAATVVTIAKAARLSKAYSCANRTHLMIDFLNEVVKTFSCDSRHEDSVG